MNAWNYFIDGFQLIFRRGLKRYVIVPMLINMVVYAAMIWVGVHEFARLMHWFEGYLPTWLQWLGVILWIIFVLVVLVVLVYTFSVIANLVAAPFNGFLSEKVQEQLTGKPLESSLKLTGVLREVPRIIWRQFKYMGYFIVCALGVLIVFFIPGLHLLAAVLWYALCAWFMGMQYIDYPMDNNRVSFREMRRLMAQKRLLYLAFGGLVLVVSMIPILNFVVIPAAVAGATKLWVSEYL